MRKKVIKFSVLLLSISGLFFFLFFNGKNAVMQNQAALPVEDKEIIASAMVDSLADVIRVPTLQSGIVKKIEVKVGQVVKKDQPLIRLDDTPAQHGVIVNKIAFQQAENSLIIQKHHLEHARVQLERLKNIDKRAVSQAELKDKIHEVAMNKMQLAQMQHNLAAAKANLDNSEALLKQFIITAPKGGVILQINAHVDEFVGGAHQIIYLGDARKVMVRVSIDERDAINFHSKANAYLTSNDNEGLKIPLKFIQLDRYIITQERLNSRVQEALYFFNRNDYPDLAAGQQFDAHILIKTS